MPHKWLKQVSRAVKTPKKIHRCIRNSEFIVNHEGERHSTHINYKHGLFQGDSLSLLLLCLCLASLSLTLSKRRGVVNGTLKRKITHTLFVDDLKIYTHSRDALKRSLNKVNGVMSGRHEACHCNNGQRGAQVWRTVKIDGSAVPITNLENPY